MTRQIVVDIVGDSSKFTKATTEAVKGSTTLTGKLQGVGKGMVIGAGIGAFNLLTGAVSLAIGKLDEAHTAFLQDETSQKLLGQALKNNIPNWDGNTKGVEEYAAAQGRLGFTDDEVRTSIGQLVGVTHDLTTAQELNTIAQDLARAKGIDLATATDIVTKAHEGNGKALKGLGIDIGTATTGADLLKAAQDNVNGSAETWAATNEGKLAVSNVKVGEAMEKVGGIIDKVSQVVAPFVADVLTGLVTVLEDVWTAIQPVITAIGDSLQPVIENISKFFKDTLIPTFNKVAEKVLPPLSRAFDWIAKNVLPPLNAILGTLITAYVNVLSTALGVLTNTVLPALTTAFDWITKNVLPPISKGLGLLVTGANTLGTTFGTLATNVKRAWDGILGSIKSVINTIIRGWNSIKFEIPSVDLGPLGRIGGFSIGTPNIPLLHSGGIVPGPPGADVLTVLQAGERVIPRNKANAGEVHIHIGTFIGSGSDIDRLADLIAQRLRLAGA